MKNTIAYLGPAGTFTEEASLAYAPDSCRLPFSSIPSVAEAVSKEKVNEGIVPIENSVEGSVTDTLDILISDPKLRIRKEIVLPIEHCLLSKPDTEIQNIKNIYSHPQALAQCRMFLDKFFPNSQWVAALSTASAVEQMMETNSPSGAIGNYRCAKLYGAQILEYSIQDSPNNLTRFIVLAKNDHPQTGTDKTSLCFSFDEDEPGLLYQVMGIFANRGINLTKVESRPTKQNLGRYIFLIDLDGHKQDKMISEALVSLTDVVSNFKILGSYPRHTK